MTSTGAPLSRAGEKRHCRTACTARSSRPDPRRRRTAHVADAAVAAHDDLEHDLAGDVLPPGRVGVVGAHFLDQPRRADAAARAIRTAAGAAAFARADAGAAAFAKAGALCRSPYRRLCRRPGSAASLSALPSAGLPDPSCPPRSARPAPSPAAASSPRAAPAAARPASVRRPIGGGSRRAGNRAADLLRALPLRLWRRRLHLQAAPAATAARTGLREKDEADRLRVVVDGLRLLVGAVRPEAADEQQRRRTRTCSDVETMNGMVACRCCAPEGVSSRPRCSALFVSSRLR